MSLKISLGPRFRSFLVVLIHVLLLGSHEAQALSSKGKEKAIENFASFVLLEFHAHTMTNVSVDRDKFEKIVQSLKPDSAACDSFLKNPKTAVTILESFNDLIHNRVSSSSEIKSHSIVRRARAVVAKCLGVEGIRKCELNRDSPQFLSENDRHFKTPMSQVSVDRPASSVGDSHIEITCQCANGINKLLNYPAKGIIDQIRVGFRVRLGNRAGSYSEDVLTMGPIRGDSRLRTIADLRLFEEALRFYGVDIYVGRSPEPEPKPANPGTNLPVPFSVYNERGSFKLVQDYLGFSYENKINHQSLRQALDQAPIDNGFFLVSQFEVPAIEIPSLLCNGLTYDDSTERNIQ